LFGRDLFVDALSVVCLQQINKLREAADRRGVS
jgi:hypothetical protein